MHPPGNTFVPVGCGVEGENRICCARAHGRRGRRRATFHNGELILLSDSLTTPRKRIYVHR